MAFLFLLLSLFAFIGFGAGPSGVSHSPAKHFEPQVVTPRSTDATRCRKVRIKGASGQATRCIYIPAKP